MFLCSCDSPGYCRVFKRDMVGRLFEICKGENVGIVARERYLARFAREASIKNAGTISVVIPVAGDCRDITEKCISSLRKNTENDINVIVVNNGCPAGIFDGLEIDTLINNRVNIGFTRAVNQGIRASKGNHVLILNNDAMVQKNSLDRMAYHLENIPKCGIVGPLTSDRGQQSLRRYNRRRIAGIPGSVNIHDVEKCVEHCQRKVVTEEKMVVFFCALLNRNMIREVGLLDERLEDGLLADDLYCLRARKKGWRLVVCYDAYVAHLHSETFRRLGLNRAALLRKAKEIFRWLPKK